MNGEKKKKKRPFCLLLYLMLALCLTSAVVCGLSVEIMAEQNRFLVMKTYFTADRDVLGNEVFRLVNEEEFAFVTGRKLLYTYLKQGIGEVNRYCEENNILYCIYTVAGRRVGGNMKVGEEGDAYTVSYTRKTAGFYAMAGIEDYRIKLKIGKRDFWEDFDAGYNGIERFMLEHAALIPAGFVLSCVLSVLFFVLLVRRHEGNSGIYRIPLEIVTAAAVLCLYYICGWLLIPQTDFIFDGMEWCRCVPVVALVGVCYLFHLITRLRSENWYRDTICYRLYRAAVKAVLRWREILGGISLIWEISLVFLCVSMAEAAAIWRVLPAGSGRWILLGLWLAEKAVLTPFLLYRALAVKRIQAAVEELAAGNLGFQLETALMPRSFREFGRDVNAVADSVSAAVEERMKSERLKTELITNVSHDIKTPLTSIINFSDLISREQTENEKITEYAGLLYKQSARLKKLIEDLIEASKASVGSLEMHPERCEVRTLLEQCIGEYEPRLREQQIEMIVKMGQEPVWILADPKLLWRIFENLMSNICKYTQRETRVYLAMNRRGDRIGITFKNISKYVLDVEADELMERFVRGDLSRHTEGSGLGLSIVRSLMELLKGKVELAVDGDLFKVMLEFPVAETSAREPDGE